MTTAPAETTTWDQIKGLHPKLPAHTSIQPRVYNGETWYVLCDALANQFHRLNSTAYQMVARMDGELTLEEILQSVRNNLGDDSALSETEIITLMQYLLAADLLICEAPVNATNVISRQHRKQDRKFEQLLKTPYVWRISLFNPNPLLNKLLGVSRFVTSPFVAFIWVVFVITAAGLALTHWNELTQHGFDELFSPFNLLLLWITYPLLKIFHELGHALLLKAWGGQIFECGLVFIVGTPLPYVDATSATGFKSKKLRVLVSCGGMAMELFIASIALVLWVNTEPGLFRSILFNIIIIGGVSTLLFNLNPLMRFDGYYILCDLVDSPNLAQRAQTQLQILCKKIFLLTPSAPQSHISPREKLWLLIYAVGALVYRFTILITIVFIAAKIWPPLGLGLGVWMIATQLFWPLAKFFRYLQKNPELNGHRAKASVFSLGLASGAIAAVCLVPIPYTTIAQGVIWMPDDALVRSEADGLVVREHVQAGSTVSAGQALLTLENLDLTSELKNKRLSLQEYEARYQNAWLKDRTQVQLYAQDIEALHAEIAHLQNKVAALTVRSASDGVYQPVRTHALTASYVKAGDTLAVIARPEVTRIRTALPQDTINQIKTLTRSVDVKPVSNSFNSLPGTIMQDIPRATYQLPSAALGTAGGGNIVVNNADKTGERAMEEVFLLDIALQQPLPYQRFGERVFVRFNYAAEPLLQQWRKPLLSVIDQLLNRSDSLAIR